MRRILTFDTKERITAAGILQHPWCVRGWLRRGGGLGACLAAAPAASSHRATAPATRRAHVAALKSRHAPATRTAAAGWRRTAWPARSRSTRWSSRACATLQVGAAQRSRAGPAVVGRVGSVGGRLTRRAGCRACAWGWTLNCWAIAPPPARPPAGMTKLRKAAILAAASHLRWGPAAVQLCCPLTGRAGSRCSPPTPPLRLGPPTTPIHPPSLLPICSYEEIHGLRELFQSFDRNGALAWLRGAGAWCGFGQGQTRWRRRQQQPACLPAAAAPLQPRAPATGTSHAAPVPALAPMSLLPPLPTPPFVCPGDGHITLDELREGLARHSKLADSEVEQVGPGQGGLAGAGLRARSAPCPALASAPATIHHKPSLTPTTHPPHPTPPHTHRFCGTQMWTATA